MKIQLKKPKNQQRKSTFGLPIFDQDLTIKSDKLGI